MAKRAMIGVGIWIDRLLNSDRVFEYREFMVPT